jgi:hypothetical protein
MITITIIIIIVAIDWCLRVIGSLLLANILMKELNWVIQINLSHNLQNLKNRDV